MRRLWLVLCLVVPFGGCLEPSGGPTLSGPPKLTVNYGPDNRTELFVHASVGEVNYTSITLRIDNATQGEQGFHRVREAFSLDVKINRTRFHANVTVVQGETVYGLESTYDVNTTARPVRIDVIREGGDVRTNGNPYSTTLDRRGGG